MRNEDFSTLSPEETALYVSHAAAEEIELKAGIMTIEQVTAALFQINEQNDKGWRAKTRSLLLGLPDKPRLEAAGKALSLEQFMELLKTILRIEDKHHWKLSPLLVGMPHQNFAFLLDQLEIKHLQVFKDEGVTEPIQHQLTTLGHTMLNQIEEAGKEIDRFLHELEHLDVQTIGHLEFSSLLQKIDRFAIQFQQLYERSKKALAIAWNTNRLDLIESLNKVKDSCLKYLLHGIGKPRTDIAPPSGLYYQLEERLFSLFGNPSNPEAVHDSEPAIEALVKFSVWYLRDYWEIGLLPDLKTPDRLDLDLDTHTEQERVSHREQLFATAKNNLSKIGLKTVRDLKNNLIFSKRTLQEYIKRNLLT